MMTTTGGHGTDQPDTPSRHDAVTTNCPVCQHPFVPVGGQIYCTDPCRAAAYRRRRDAHNPPIKIPKSRPRRPITIYECDNCSERALGNQYCQSCSTFIRRMGIGAACPTCDAPVSITDLVDPAVTT